MKKRFFYTIFILVSLLSVMIGTQIVNVGRANPMPETYIHLTLENPQQMTYKVNTLTLNFSASYLSFFKNFKYSYSLDGQEQKLIENITIISESGIPINPGFYSKTLNGSCVLSNLSEGWHNITIYQSTDKGVYASSYVWFIIDRDPIVSIFSPENKTYTTSNLPLNFTVSERVAWLGYSLDGQANETISKNSTLVELAEGPHSLVLYAKDYTENTGTSEIVNFNVKTTIPEFPSWTLLPILSIATLLIIIGKHKLSKTDIRSPN